MSLRFGQNVVAGLPLLPHRPVCLGRPVVVGAEPRVEWYAASPVIAFEVTVMQLILDSTNKVTTHTFIKPCQG